MNGGAGEIIGDFPFMLSLVEAFIGFFSRITFQTLTPFDPFKHECNC